MPNQDLFAAVFLSYCLAAVHNYTHMHLCKW